MSSAFSLPDEGDEIDGPGPSKPIRLSEVPQIAERFEGGVDGSLKEAFALRSADVPDAPEPAIIERAVAEPMPSEADSVAVAPAPIPVRPPEVALTEPPHPAEIAETTPGLEKLAESPEASQPTAETARDMDAQPPAELAPPAAGDRAEAPSPAPAPLAAEATEMRGPPAEEQKKTEGPLTGGPVDAHAPSFTADATEPGADAALSAFPPVAPPLFQAEETTRPFAGTHAGIFPLEFASDVGANRLERSSFDEHLAAERTPDLSEPAATERPLASALDTAAKLAADANAAAEALENLKRLLERELPNPSQASQQPIHEIFAEVHASHEPPPLPAHEPLSEEPTVEEAPSPEPKPFSRPGARSAPWRDRRQFDVRGFMAGFALSWAIGAALYIYLTAG